MKTITQRELSDDFAAIMDAVEAGETYRITRSGTEVAELRPIHHRRHLTATEHVAGNQRVPPTDYARMREEADEYFGTEDRVGDDDPWERHPHDHHTP